jgi:hypothetical protein
MNGLQKLEPGVPFDKTPSKGSAIALLMVTAVVILAIMMMGYAMYSSHKKAELVRYQDAIAMTITKDPDSLFKFIDGLTDKAVKACGHDERCLYEWTRTDYPKYVDGKGLTDHEKLEIEDQILRKAITIPK